MSWIGGGLGTAGLSLLGGFMNSNAANQAAGDIEGQLQQALNFGQGIYSTAQSNFQPYISAGQTGLSGILGLLGLQGGAPGASAQNSFNQFTSTPAYQFPLQQGQLGLNRQLASSGLTGSGAALKDATAFNQGRYLGRWQRTSQGMIFERRAGVAHQFGGRQETIELDALVPHHHLRVLAGISAEERRLRMQGFEIFANGLRVG